MNRYNPDYKTWIAVDCSIFGYDTDSRQLHVLLFKRKVEPFANDWSLIGSIVQPHESTDEAAKRVLEEFTGLSKVYLNQLNCYSKINRDPGGRVLSVLYTSLIEFKAISEEKASKFGASWFKFNALPEVVLDHNEMINNAIAFLQKNANSNPIGFELLPKLFTLPQLLDLYQAIYGRTIDDRNFRKKILSTGLLIKHDKKDKSTSKKGAFLYQFDKVKYKQLVNNGFHIEF